MRDATLLVLGELPQEPGGLVPPGGQAGSGGVCAGRGRRPRRPSASSRRNRAAPGRSPLVRRRPCPRSKLVRARSMGQRHPAAFRDLQRRLEVGGQPVRPGQRCLEVARQPSDPLVGRGLGDRWRARACRSGSTQTIVPPRPPGASAADSPASQGFRSAPSPGRSAAETRRAWIGRPSMNRLRSSARACRRRVPPARLPRRSPCAMIVSRSARHRPVQLPQPRWVFLRHPPDQAGAVLLLERRPQRQQLVQRQTQA